MILLNSNTIYRQLFYGHTGVSRCPAWIPACAGMTNLIWLFYKKSIMSLRSFLIHQYSKQNLIKLIIIITIFITVAMNMNIYNNEKTNNLTNTKLTNSFRPEQVYANAIEIFGRQIPLPGDNWILAGIGTDPIIDTRPYGIIGTVVLFKLDKKSVIAFTLIHANALAIDGGWGLSSDCQNNKLAFTKIYENGEQHAFCSSLRSLTTQIEPSPQDLLAWKNAIKLARQRGWYVPIRWREVGFRISDWHDVLDIRYAFKSQRLITQIQSPKLEITPESILIKWIDEMVPRVYLGFKRALIGYATSPMPCDPISLTENERSTGITELKELSNSVFSLIKVAVNRIVNISTSLGITYLFVGNIYLATSLQLVSSTFHSGVNYVEELLWNTYGPQRLRKANTYDFTYVGKGE